MTKWVFVLGQDFSHWNALEVAHVAAHILRMDNQVKSEYWTRFLVQCGATLTWHFKPTTSMCKIHEEYVFAKWYRRNSIQGSLRRADGFVPQLISLVLGYLGPVIAIQCRERRRPASEVILYSFEADDAALDDLQRSPEAPPFILRTTMVDYGSSSWSSSSNSASQDLDT
jgi:hypothetical protein